MHEHIQQGILLRYNIYKKEYALLMGKSEISRNIKRVREQKNITQRKLSEEMNCSEVHISNLERDMANPSMKILINMANSLDVPLSELLYNKDKENSEYDITEYEGMFGELSSVRTVYILKMLYDIKKHLAEYLNNYQNTENMVAEEIDYKALGNSIEFLREEKHISKSVMAKRVGINEGTYRNIESNSSTASVEKYMEIADELHVPIDFLFDKSLNNKEMISKEYIRKVFCDAKGKEKQILEEIASIIYKILRGHGV